MWFNKKEEKGSEVSELPQLPELPEFPEVQKKDNLFLEKPVFKPELSQSNSIKDELPDLPALPALPRESIKISQEAVKSEIEKEKIKPYTREIPSGHFRTESSDSVREYTDSRRKEEKLTKEIRENKFQPEAREFTPRFQPSSSEKAEPIFVRIDKFQNAIKSFSEIKKQLDEIGRFLDDIKQVRAREDQELGEWEREIMDIKSKLDSIDRGVFSKLG